MGYIEPFSMFLMAGARSIGSAVINNRKRKSGDFVDYISDSDFSLTDDFSETVSESLFGFHLLPLILVVQCLRLICLVKELISQL